jgi:hypothetical protein
MSGSSSNSEGETQEEQFSNYDMRKVLHQIIAENSTLSPEERVRILYFRWY